MDKAISLSSKYALEAQRKGLNNSSFNDENYQHYFDLLNESNNAFGITDVENIRDISEKVSRKLYERNINANSGYVMESTIYGSNANNWNNQSARYGRASGGNAELFEREQRQFRGNEDRQVVKGSIRVTQKELDNSSFILIDLFASSTFFILN